MTLASSFGSHRCKALPLRSSARRASPSRKHWKVLLLQSATATPCVCTFAHKRFWNSAASSLFSHGGCGCSAGCRLRCSTSATASLPKYATGCSEHPRRVLGGIRKRRTVFSLELAAFSKTAVLRWTEGVDTGPLQLPLRRKRWSLQWQRRACSCQAQSATIDRGASHRRAPNAPFAGFRFWTRATIARGGPAGGAKMSIHAAHARPVFFVFSYVSKFSFPQRSRFLSGDDEMNGLVGATQDPGAIVYHGPTLPNAPPRRALRPTHSSRSTPVLWTHFQRWQDQQRPEPCVLSGEQRLRRPNSSPARATAPWQARALALSFRIAQGKFRRDSLQHPDKRPPAQRIPTTTSA